MRPIAPAALSAFHRAAAVRNYALSGPCTVDGAARKMTATFPCRSIPLRSFSPRPGTTSPQPANTAGAVTETAPSVFVLSMASLPMFSFCVWPSDLTNSRLE
jgi:hypothetical protein